MVRHYPACCADYRSAVRRSLRFSGGVAVQRTGEGTAMLQLRDVSRRYGQTVALDGLSLDVPEGEVVGFVGPNGAGKTTAMRIALGVLETDTGDVSWRG